MNKELKKRILHHYFTFFITSNVFLFIYNDWFIIDYAIIIWIEFYALISKIIKGNKFQDIFFRFIFKVSFIIVFIYICLFYILIESDYTDLKIYLLYSVLVAILSDIGGLVFGKTFKGKKLTKISPNKTISGSIGSIVLSWF